MKYRVEVYNNGEELWVDIWHYEGNHDNPWKLIARHRYENGTNHE